MRRPYQVLILLYTYIDNKPYYYVFKKGKFFWQFVSGGGEDCEELKQTVIRELFEETGLQVNKTLKQLNTVCYIPVEPFIEKYNVEWEDVFVIPEYCFSMQVGSEEKICLSSEHIEYRLCDYAQAKGILKFDSNKTALYELNRRLIEEVDL